MNLVAADQDAPGTPSAIQLQEECLRYRDEITRHGFVFVRSVNEGSDVRSEAEYRVWFSDDRLRFDIRGGQEGGGERPWEHFVVERDRYTWIPEGELEGVIAPAREYEQQQGGVMGHFSLFHPRWLGMGANSESLMQREPMARTVSPGMTKAKYKTVSLEAMAAFQTWRVAYETSFPPPKPGDARNSGECVMWFAPEAGGSLVRAELREFGTPWTKVRSVESHLEQFPENGAWFPRRVIRETKYNGRVTRREVIVVEEAVFGRAPEDKHFTLADMNLPKGKQVSDRSTGPRETVLVWDGREMVAIRGPQASLLPPPRGDRKIWLWAGNAIVLGVLGIACLFRLWLRRKRSNKC